MIVGCFKQIENTKEIELPIPAERQKLKEEIKIEEEKPKPFMLEKPGFPPLKPIIPDPEEQPKTQPLPDSSRISKIPDVLSSLRPAGPIPMSQPESHLLAPVLYKPAQKPSEPEPVNTVPEVVLPLLENSELTPLKITVPLPPTYVYQLQVHRIDTKIKGNSFGKAQATQLPCTPIGPFELLENEIILDIKTVNLTCDKGTKGDYICVSTSIIKASGGEDELYRSRILVFEILHDLEKIAEVQEKRSAVVVDCCRGYLLSSTEGPEMSTNTLGFKIQLYKLSKSNKRMLDPNPTEPTKIMATTVNVMKDLVLFADVRKSFSIMVVKDQQNSFQPVLKRAYECFSEVTVKASELWRITDPTPTEESDCVAVVSTEDNHIQIYTSLYETMQLKGEVNLGRKVTGLKKITIGDKSKSILYVTQQGTVGVLIETKKKLEMISEAMIETLSMKLPWQGGHSPLHSLYFPKVYYNQGWRKIAKNSKRNISCYSEMMLFHELPLSVQQRLIANLNMNLIDFKKITNII